jgi:hypothetical protein
LFNASNTPLTISAAAPGAAIAGVVGSIVASVVACSVGSLAGVSGEEVCVAVHVAFVSVSPQNVLPLIFNVPAASPFDLKVPANVNFTSSLLVKVMLNALSLIAPSSMDVPYAPPTEQPPVLME